MFTTTIEDLTAWVPQFLPFPRILLLRLYPPGVEPIEPNPFCFAVVAVVRRRVATIKGLCGGVSSQHVRAGEKALSAIGVRQLVWRHDGVAHRVDLGLSRQVKPRKSMGPDSIDFQVI